MSLTGLNLLLTYRRSMACDHCYVFGSPGPGPVMSLSQVADIVRQADEVVTVEWLTFEGGEPFLCHEYPDSLGPGRVYGEGVAERVCHRPPELLL